MAAHTKSNRDALVRFLNTASDAEIGMLFKEYMLETMHGSFEGYSTSEVKAIYAMMADMNLYRENM